MALSLKPIEIVEKGEYPLLVKAEHWERVHLNDIAKVQNGFAFKSNFFSTDAGVPLIRIRDIENKETEHYYTGTYDKEYIVTAGEILIGMDGDFNASRWRGENGLLNQRVCKISPTSSLYVEKFLFLCLQPYLNAINAETSSVTVKHLSSKTIEEIPLPLPPLNEQHRIVAKIEELFSELDKGVESLTTAREQLKVYRQAILKHAFEGKLTEQWRAEHADQLETADQLLARIKKEREKRYQEQLAEWEKAVEEWEAKGKKSRRPRKPSIFKPLPEISEEEVSLLPKVPSEWQFLRLAEIAQIGSGMSVSKNRKLEDPVEIPYLRVANVQRGVLILDEVKTMQIESEMLNELKLEKYDVLFNEGGDRDKLGRGWIWESQVDPCITQNHVFRATTYLGGEYHSKFVSHWGNTFGRDYFETFGKQTTNLASINKTVLSMFPVPIPSPKEQEKIIEEIDSMMTTIDFFEKDIDAALSHSVALRQSILKKAFSGELISQDPNDESASELLARIKAEREGAQLHAKRKPRKTKKRKEVMTMADLMDVIKDAKDWMSAQEVFRKCGIADGAETDAIEKIYEELRGYVKENKIAVERRGEEDWLRLAQGA